MNKVITCLHCGNQTQMEAVANYKKTEQFEDMWEEITYTLFLCPVCKNVTLEKKSLFSEDIVHVAHLDEYEQHEEIEKATRVEYIYPHNSVEGDYIPKNVKQAFEAALRVRNIDAAICAIAIRRTLEMMCKEKGETGRNLYTMLKNLSEKGILPPILNDMASVLRELGNTAAHADDAEFNQDLVPSMIEFTKIILDYVYNLPKRIEHIQDSIGKKTGKAFLKGEATVLANAEVIKNE
jgi:hypothetical protein